jgi:hypothetical protein
VASSTSRASSEWARRSKFTFQPRTRTAQLRSAPPTPMRQENVAQMPRCHPLVVLPTHVGDGLTGRSVQTYPWCCTSPVRPRPRYYDGVLRSTCRPVPVHREAHRRTLMFRFRKIRESSANAWLRSML